MQKQNVGKNAKKAGAPRGNRNALKHGAYAAANIARHKAIHAYCERMRWTVALVHAIVDARAGTDAHLPLLRAAIAGGMQHGGAAEFTVSYPPLEGGSKADSCAPATDATDFSGRGQAATGPLPEKFFVLRSNSFRPSLKGRVEK